LRESTEFLSDIILSKLEELTEADKAYLNKTIENVSKRSKTDQKYKNNISP
jgi:hypothetical protein